MHKGTPYPDEHGIGRCQLPPALDQIRHTVIDGLHHGYFRITIFSRVVKGDKRELVIEAGKNYKYTIPKSELRR